MSLHGLGGPSKHNAAEEFWRQRLAKEAKAAEAKATGDSRVSSGFAPAQRSAYVAAEPLIPRAGDYRCARLPPPLAPRPRGPRPSPPVAHTRAPSSGGDCRNFAETSQSCLFAGGGIVLPGSPRGRAGEL